MSAITLADVCDNMVFVACDNMVDICDSVVDVCDNDVDVCDGAASRRPKFFAV